MEIFNKQLCIYGFQNLDQVFVEVVYTLHKNSKKEVISANNFI